MWSEIHYGCWLFPSSSIFKIKHFNTQSAWNTWQKVILHDQMQLIHVGGQSRLMMEMWVCCFEVPPHWSWTTQIAIWLTGPATQSCWDKIDGRFLLFWAHTSPHDTGLSASTVCVHTQFTLLDPHYLSRFSKLIVFPLLMATMWMTLEEAFY